MSYGFHVTWPSSRIDCDMMAADRHRSTRNSRRSPFSPFPWSRCHRGRIRRTSHRTRLTTWTYSICEVNAACRHKDKGPPSRKVAWSSDSGLAAESVLPVDPHLQSNRRTAYLGSVWLIIRYESLTHHPLELLRFLRSCEAANVDTVSTHRSGEVLLKFLKSSFGSKSTSSTYVKHHPLLAARPKNPQSQNTIFRSLTDSGHCRPVEFFGLRLMRSNMSSPTLWIVAVSRS